MIPRGQRVIEADLIDGAKENLANEVVEADEAYLANEADDADLVNESDESNNANNIDDPTIHQS